MRFLLILPLLATLGSSAQDKVLFKVSRSHVTFRSEAPLEEIAAGNNRATGLLDATARTFAVRIPIVEFQGFNGPLQREHFNENYLVSRMWPNATFTGRIIEAVDLAVPGTHEVRAKGQFTIRDVSHERIVPCRVVVSADGIRVTADLDVVLADHGISIPKVVEQKIAPVVQVVVDLLFKPEATAR
ncbi:MAG: YceI family protein [Flavobacteriales bacterium]|nr:YceI family protein [Flavobacteriales bacterium]